MSPSRIQPSTPESPDDRRRRATPKGLVWLMIPAVAAFAFAWWW